MPTPESEIDRFLQSTLEDFRLSRAERQALAQAVQADATQPQGRSLWRVRAFQIVRESGPDPVALDWLEEVLRPLDASANLASNERRPPLSAARFSPGDSCWREIVNRFQNAQRSADVCVFTITDDRITSAILDAHDRSVAVRVLTDDDKAHDLGSDIARLEQHGIPVRTDRRPSHMHHKFAILDGSYLLHGSYNWTRGAAAENHENLFTTTELSLITAFQREFEQIWTDLA